MKDEKIAVERLQSAESEKLFNFCPVFFAAIFLCFGIVFSYYHIFHGLSLWWLTASIPVVFLTFMLCKNRVGRKKLTFALGLLGVAFVVGGGIFAHIVHDYKNTAIYNGQYNVVGRVREKAEYDYSVKLIL